MNMNRRKLILSATTLALFSVKANALVDIKNSVLNTEASLSARIGVFAQNLQTGRKFQYREDERFAMCSTFKTSLVAACFYNSDQGRLDLTERLSYGISDILPTSPVTKKHLAQGYLDIQTLCQAAIEYSDNTAANLLLKRIGGPVALTSFFREIGDSVSRLDRFEMALNSNTLGDPRDTTTPRAMANNLNVLINGTTILSRQSQDLLVAFMRNEQNAKNRIRAAVAKDWIVANKPGTTPNGAVNDIAMIWSTDRVPFVVSIYIDTQNKHIEPAILAIRDIARLSINYVS